jgi:hypothetical protein
MVLVLPRRVVKTAGAAMLLRSLFRHSRSEDMRVAVDFESTVAIRR